jgi:hypothetical protein
MQTLMIIFLAVCEVIAVFMILRLWSQKQKTFLGRCFWSLVLLIPFFGLICYIFLNISPDAHGESLPEYPPDTGHP